MQIMDWMWRLKLRARMIFCPNKGIIKKKLYSKQLIPVISVNTWVVMHLNSSNTSEQSTKVLHILVTNAHCMRTTPWRKTLKQHKESKHKGIRYPCDQCIYAATMEKDLKRHKERKHEDNGYPCDQCEFSSTCESHLKRNIAVKHKCDAECTKLESLKSHQQRKHN